MTWYDIQRLPLKPHFQTAFQAKLFTAIQAIPSGQTRTYAQLAQQLQTSPRAVARAISKNPIAILIPCHRVIKADGGLGGYFGTSPDMLAVKSRLLQSEMFGNSE
jgi:O-6-methylguanine DNA methyltransferase